MAGTFYGKDKFEPYYIVAQIVAIQCLYFMSLGFLYCLMDAIMGETLSLDQIFTSQPYSNMSTRNAWSSVFAVFLNVPLTILWLMWIVERAKKCLDFVSTLFIFHVMGCMVYKEIPQHWEWWGCHIFASVASVLFGEYACAQREMKEIILPRKG